MNKARRKVFISHSSEDIVFVRRLADGLARRNVPAWIDRQALEVGDSIVAGISSELSEADYLLVVLSRNSVQSQWVQNELNVALMEEASRKNITVLPAVIDDCEIPVLLRDRIYADFRKSFEEGLSRLLRVFAQEAESGQGQPQRPANLPFLSLGTLFKGRQSALKRLRERLQSGGGAVGVVARHAIHGLGGVGKTRLAVEYAWQHQSDYTALLFVEAPSPSDLQRNLAELCKPAVLDLPEAAATEEPVKVDAVLGWLERESGWLLIFDNVDTPQAAAAVERLLVRLRRGHVLITSRLADWSAAVKPLELDVLEESASVDFLLERTVNHRRRQADDKSVAAQLARQLDNLALALEQAGAYVAQRRCSLRDYLKRWQSEDEKVREWFDERLMQYPRSVATTWETTVALLDQPARELLRVLSWLAPEPIPADLLTEEETDEAVAQLVSYSLARWDAAPVSPLVGENESSEPRSGPGGGASETLALRLHRLVQEITRMRTPPEEHGVWVEQALNSVNDAWPGDPQDVRSWPAWDALRPHVAAVIDHADEFGIHQPTTRLMNGLGLLLKRKCLFDQAEPLYRRALAIDEQSYGADHPDVAIRLNNLAQLLKATNRLAEAEPLMRRALAILATGLVEDHPHTITVRENYRTLLGEMGLSADEIERRVRVAMETGGPFEPMTPEVDRLLGPAAPVEEVLAALDGQYKAEGRPDVYFLPPDQPLAPHLDELLGPLPEDNAE